MKRKKSIRSLAMLLSFSLILSLAIVSAPAALAAVGDETFTTVMLNAGSEGTEIDPAPAENATVAVDVVLGGLTIGTEYTLSGTLFGIANDPAVTFTATAATYTNTLRFDLDDNAGAYQTDAVDIELTTATPTTVTYGGTPLTIHQRGIFNPAFNHLGPVPYYESDVDFVLNASGLDVTAATTSVTFKSAEVDDVALTGVAVAANTMNVTSSPSPVGNGRSTIVDGECTVTFPRNTSADVAPNSAGRLIDLVLGLDGKDCLVYVDQMADPGLTAEFANYAAGTQPTIHYLGGVVQVNLSNINPFVQRETSLPVTLEVTSGTVAPIVGNNIEGNAGNRTIEVDTSGLITGSNTIDLFIPRNSGGQRTLNFSLVIDGANSTELSIIQFGASTSSSSSSGTSAITPITQSSATSSLSLTYTDAQMTEMFGSNNALTLNITASQLASLTLPLSWFADPANADKVLYINVEGVGSIAVTPRLLLDIAQQALTGSETNTKTATIGDIEYKFNPSTLITFEIAKGSLKLGILVDKKALAELTLDSPICVTLPFKPEEGQNPDNIVGIEKLENGETRIIPLSTFNKDTATLLVDNAGTYDVAVNKVDFADVTDEWMIAPVNYVAARGIMNGVGEATFAPTKTLTRAQYVTMLMRTFAVELKGAWMPTPPADIADVPEWANTYVLQATAMGILVGNDGDNFNPNAPITREDMFTITYNLLKGYHLISATEGMALSEFGDADQVSEYANEAMLALVKADLVHGDGTNLTPLSESTRAQAAQFVQNLVKYLVVQPEFKNIKKVG